MMRLSKAQALLFLKDKVQKSKILPPLVFKASSFIPEVINDIKAFFKNNVIVRSSSFDEDTEYFSNAGHYKSILDVNINNDDEISNAIKEVILSYNGQNLGKNEILIQPMLKNVVYSGVVFTSDLDSLSSYYIVNYDTKGSTSSVTDGTGKNLKTYIEYKNAFNIQRKSPFLDQLIKAVKELELILDNSFLDIEFGYDGKDIYIFQVRPIVKENKHDLSEIDYEKALYKLHKKIKKLNCPHPNLLGNYTMYGVMPDWNPAEIIGKKPKKLSLSLYKELITDSIWANQRSNYGYRDLCSHPLLVSFLGVAYIDIRVSFNSFIPNSLNKETAEKLVEFYLEYLKNNPSRHDKVEFDIILSCYDFSTNSKLENLYAHNFSKDEINSIKVSLIELTNNVFSLYKDDLNKIEVLKEKYELIMKSNLSLIDKIYWLTEDCKRYGTLPFAGLARCAFIAVSFLKSFIDKNIISNNEYVSFMNSLQTVSKKLSKEYNELEIDSFLEKYGHLRPGTYEITSKRYDESFHLYFSKSKVKSEEKENFSFTKHQLSQIDNYLKKSKLKITAIELVEFIKKSIEAREYGKFIFTKSLSEILVLIEELAKRHNIKKEDMAYLDFKTILSLYSDLSFEDIKSLFEKQIKINKKLYKITQGINLPDLLKNEFEIYSFYNLDSSANFVTLSSVEAEIVTEERLYIEDLKNKIICIRSADPGYDFLFTKKIAGLVTCYGGANSHMAIRCAELNIPAVIGVGEKSYANIIKYNYIGIDCNIQKIKRIG